MNRGFCYLAEQSQCDAAIDRIISSLAAADVRFPHPTSGLTTHLVGDGDAVEVTQEELSALAQSGVHVAFQLWLNPDTYIACSFRKLEHDAVRHAYSFDGLTAAERRQILTWAVNYFRSRAAEASARLLVGDADAVTAATDWDAVVNGAQKLPSRRIPSILGMPANWASDIPQLEGTRREELRGYEIWSHP